MFSDRQVSALVVGFGPDGAARSRSPHCPRPVGVAECHVFVTWIDERLLQLLPACPCVRSEGFAVTRWRSGGQTRPRCWCGSCGTQGLLLGGEGRGGHRVTAGGGLWLVPFQPS